MIDYPEYTLTLPPPCPTNQDHLMLLQWPARPRNSLPSTGSTGPSGRVIKDLDGMICCPAILLISADYVSYEVGPPRMFFVSLIP